MPTMVFSIELNGADLYINSLSSSSVDNPMNYSSIYVWFGLVRLRFGLAKFCSQINGVGFSEAACKISAQ